MKKISVAWVAVLVSWNSVLAGVVFEIETRDHRQSPAKTETAYVATDGRSLAMDFRSGQSSQSDRVIFLGDRQEMLFLDRTRKSFMVMDARTMRKMKQAFGQARVQSPEAQRPHSIIRKVVDHQVVEMHGYPCVLFEMVRDGRKIRNLWVTDWNNIQGGRELKPMFNEMSTFFRTLTRSMPPLGKDSMVLNENVFATIRELGGFPVASRDYAADGTIESESALRSSKQLQIAPAAFEPPADYKQQAMF